MVLFLLTLELFLRIIDYKIVDNVTELRFINNVSLMQIPHITLSNNENLVYELTPNFTLYEQTNSLGMRDTEYSIIKPNTTIRIIMIGDSVLNGPLIPNDLRFSELLEKKIKSVANFSVEIMNTGVGGYNIYQQYEVFKKIIKLDPDIVIYHAVVNDAKKKFAKKSLKGIQIYEYSEYYPYFFDFKYNKELMSFSYFYRFLNQKLLYVFNTTQKGAHNPDIENYKNKLNEIIITAKNKKISFFVVLHPLLIKYSNKYDIYNSYRDIFVELNLTFFELFPVYYDYDPHELRVKDKDIYHLSKFGHNITAEALYDFFEPIIIDTYQAQT